MACTFNGASVNRCLVALHNRSNKLVYKVQNIRATDD